MVEATRLAPFKWSGHRKSDADMRERFWLQSEAIYERMLLLAAATLKYEIRPRGAAAPPGLNVQHIESHLRVSGSPFLLMKQESGRNNACSRPAENEPK